VNHVAERPDTALEKALSLAHTIREVAPLAVAAVKEALRATEHLVVEDAYARTRQADLPRYRAMPASADAQEGPRAFAEKRAPRWTGA
jgi:crotonobetainyl-CoA hydratase